MSASEDAQICLQEDGDFSSLLFEMNVPASLLLKRPLAEMNTEQEDSLEPGSTVLARSAADVAEVLIHLAGESQKSKKFTCHAPRFSTINPRAQQSDGTFHTKCPKEMGF